MAIQIIVEGRLHAWDGARAYEGEWLRIELPVGEEPADPKAVALAIYAADHGLAPHDLVGAELEVSAVEIPAEQLALAGILTGVRSL